MELAQNFNNETIWDHIPEGYHEVEFEDGILRLDEGRILYSHHFWRLFVKFPGAGIKRDHALQGRFESGTQMALGGKIFHDVYTGAHRRKELTFWDMSETFYEIANDLYNNHIVHLSEYVVSGCALDLLDVIDHPEIAKAKENFRKRNVEGYVDTFGVDDVHQVINHVLYGENGELEGNEMKSIAQCDVVGKGSMKQLMGPRGGVYDLDGRLFDPTIENGYFEGLNANIDSLMEKCSATRALSMNEKPLQDSELFNREMQLTCSTILRAEGKSCKKFRTVKWTVKADEGKLLWGKNHMVDGKPVMIDDDNFGDLVDTTIEYRSIATCGNKNPQTVCRCCLGWSARAVPPETNLGYALCTGNNAVITQLMLSTKHFEANGTSMHLDLEDGFDKDTSDWLFNGLENKRELYLHKNKRHKRPMFKLELKAVKNLNTIMGIDIDELAPDRITSVEEMQVCPTDKDGNIDGLNTNLNLTVAGGGSCLSSHVLKYIKRNEWGSNNKFVFITLGDDFDFTKPIFVTPRRGDNIQLFLEEVKGFLTRASKSHTKVTDYTSVGACLQEFVNILHRRLSFNIVTAEIFIRACMTVDHPNGDWRLPTTDQPFVFASVLDCLKNRSLAGLLAYEQQNKAMLRPDLYQDAGRMDHPLDSLLASNT